MAGTPTLNDSGYLGSAGGTSCYVARTNLPWTSGIDAIAVSVGSGLGSLGHAVRERFPDAAWDAVDYDAILPEQPSLCDKELRDWRQLHRGLAHVSATLRIDTLSRFQQWVPAVRRFSYVLAPAS